MKLASAHLPIAAAACVGCLLLPGCLNPEGTRVVDSLRQERVRRAQSRPADAASETGAADAMPVLSGDLSLQDAVVVALANNKSLKAQYLKRSESDALFMQANASALPQVALTGYAEESLPHEDDSDTYSLGVQVTQPFWRSGSVAAGIRYARLYVASTDLTIQESVQQTLRDVAGQYLDVLLEEHLVQVYQEAAEVSERLLQTARNRRAQGTVSDYEVLRAEVEVANTKAELINERNTHQSAMVALYQMLGVSQTSQVSLTGRLAYKPEAYDLESASAKAFVERPDLARSLAAVHMAEENVKIAESAYGPSADLYADSAYSNEKSGDWNDEWSVGVRVSLTLFDGLERRGRVLEKKSILAQARETLLDLEEKAHVEVVNALLQLKYADELYQSQMKNRDLATEALRIMEAGSRRGRNTQVEVMDARAALTEAMGTYYKAVYSHAMARLSVLGSMGVLRPDDSLWHLAGSLSENTAAEAATEPAEGGPESTGE